jgi:hypothetical protein
VWGARFEARLDGFESKVDATFDRLESKFEALQKTMNTQFKWLVGLQFGMLVTVIGVLLSR